MATAAQRVQVYAPAPALGTIPMRYRIARPGRLAADIRGTTSAHLHALLPGTRVSGQSTGVEKDMSKFEATAPRHVYTLVSRGEHQESAYMHSAATRKQTKQGHATSAGRMKSKVKGGGGGNGVGDGATKATTTAAAATKTRPVAININTTRAPPTPTADDGGNRTHSRTITTPPPPAHTMAVEPAHTWHTLPRTPAAVALPREQAADVYGPALAANLAEIEQKMLYVNSVLRGVLPSAPSPTKATLARKGGASQRRRNKGVDAKKPMQPRPLPAINSTTLPATEELPAVSDAARRQRKQRAPTPRPRRPLSATATPTSASRTLLGDEFDAPELVRFSQVAVLPSIPATPSAATTLSAPALPASDHAALVPAATSSSVGAAAVSSVTPARSTLSASLSSAGVSSSTRRSRGLSFSSVRRFSSCFGFHSPAPAALQHAKSDPDDDFSLAEPTKQSRRRRRRHRGANNEPSTDKGREAQHSNAAEFGTNGHGHGAVANTGGGAGRVGEGPAAPGGPTAAQTRWRMLKALPKVINFIGYDMFQTDDELKKRKVALIKASARAEAEARARSRETETAEQERTLAHQLAERHTLSQFVMTKGPKQAWYSRVFRDVDSKRTGVLTRRQLIVALAIASSQSKSAFAGWIHDVLDLLSHATAGYNRDATDKPTFCILATLAEDELPQGVSIPERATMPGDPSYSLGGPRLLRRLRHMQQLFTGCGATCTRDGEDCTEISAEALEVYLAAGATSARMKAELLEEFARAGLSSVAFIDFAAHLPLFTTLHRNMTYNPMALVCSSPPAPAGPTGHARACPARRSSITMI